MNLKKISKQSSKTFLCLTESSWDESPSDKTFLTAAYSVIAKAVREINLHGGVAIMAKKNWLHKKNASTIHFAVVYRLIPMELLFYTILQTLVSIVYNVVSNCLSSAYNVLSNASIDKVLIMGDFNLQNEDWAQFPAISTEYFCETEKFLTSKIFTQLIKEPTHKDGNVLDLVFTNYDEPEVLDSEKHPTFSDHFSISAGIPKNSETMYTQTDLKQYSLAATDLNSIDLTLFSFELDQNSVDFIADWLTSFQNILKQFLVSKRQKQKILPDYLSSHSIHLFNCLQTELKQLNGLNLKNYMKYNNICEELESSTELDTNVFLDKFCAVNGDVNDCYKLIRKLKISDIPKTMIDPKTKKNYR